jgi:hypothetical protein
MYFCLMSTKTKQTFFYFFFSLVYFSLAMPAVNGGIDLDASWHESLVMAIENKMVFGRDFIFNYGPLGFLNTGVLPRTVSVGVMVLFEVFLLANYLFIIDLCFRKANKKTWLVALSALLILIPWGFFSDTTFTLFYLLLFWLLYAHRTQNTAALLVSVLLTLLIFYIKVNLSIIAYVVFYASLLYFGLSKIFSFRTILILFLIQILATYFLSFLFHVDIPAYLLASLKIIDAYQDAMAEMILSKKEFLILFAFEILILLIAIVLIIKNLKQIFIHKKLLYLYLLVALAWLLCFKQAHTAVGHYNVFGFFLLMPMLGVLLYLFSTDAMKLEAAKTFVLILVVQIIATQYIRFSMGNHTLKGYLLTFPPHSVAVKLDKELKISTLSEIFIEKNPFNFVKKLWNYDYENQFQNEAFLQQKQIPEKILKKIGKATVDIVPTDISLIFFNRLAYNPRPVIQSYQANSDWLMQKNGEKYASKTAPEYVFYRIDSFRGQHPFWIETDLNRALLQNYRLEDTLLIAKDTLFLFHHLPHQISLETKKISTIHAELNQEINVPDGEKMLIFSANVKYSFLGKLLRLFFQPPYLYCTITYENGRQESYRVIDKILKGGIFINPKVTNQGEAARFFLKKGVGNQKILKLKFWTKLNKGFIKDFEGSFQTVIL